MKAVHELSLGHYKICLRGHIDQHWADWFDGFVITYSDDTTLLDGAIPDQAALHGILAKIRDLGLVILLVANLANEVAGCEDA